MDIKAVKLGLSNCVRLKKESGLHVNKVIIARQLDGKSTYDKIRTYFLGSNNVGLDLSTLRCLVPNSRLLASRAAAERTEERTHRNNSTRIRQNEKE
jgi:hypothetical protein